MIATIIGLKVNESEKKIGDWYKRQKYESIIMGINE